MKDPSVRPEPRLHPVHPGVEIHSWRERLLPGFRPSGNLHGDEEGVSIHEVPGVAVQFAFNIGDQARWPIQSQGFAAAEGDAQQGIES